MGFEDSSVQYLGREINLLKRQRASSVGKGTSGWDSTGLKARSLEKEAMVKGGDPVARSSLMPAGSKKKS